MVKRRHSAREDSDGDDESLQSRQEMIRKAKMVFKTFREEVANDLDSSEFGDNPLVVEGIDSFYLLCEDTPVSITELPLSIDGAEALLSDRSEPIHLLGETRSGTGEIKLRAEMWKLWGLGRNFGPRISIKTPNGWTRLHDPRPVYRKVMNDGLTLVHLLHYIEGNPNASAGEIEAYLKEEFGKHEERPALKKLPAFYSIVKSYLEKESEGRRNAILREIFPEQFYQESVAQEFDLNKSLTLYCGWDESHGGLEESHGQIRACEYQQQDPNSGDNSTSTPLNLIAGLKDTLEILREINRSENGAHRSVKDDLYELPPRSTRKLSPYIPYVRSTQAALAALEAENLLNEGRGNGAVTKRSIPLITTEEESKYDGKAYRRRRRGRPSLKDGKIDDKFPKLDKNAKLDDPPICVICDEGGDLLCCEGPCQRYFHAIEGTTGRESHCKTLGMTKLEVKETIKYYCRNCRFQKQQCFICGELGSSAPSLVLGHQEVKPVKASLDINARHDCTPNPVVDVNQDNDHSHITTIAIEVFVCRASVCRKFYHPECVAKALLPKSDWKTLAQKIQRGQEGFQCPRHCCRVCQAEELNPGDLVQCRRCPKAWHYDCFQDYEFSKELPETEIWKHFRRKFVFCKDHEVIPRLQTPARDHLKFP